jgi:hypothetical protein
MQWVAVVQQLNRDLFAIEMTRSGLLLQKQAIGSIPLIKADGIPISKDEFKELGSTRIIFEQTSVEVLIGLTANAIETFAIRLQRHLSVQWEPFRFPQNGIRFANRVRQFRALNNVFKHQEGYIDAKSSRSAKHLVDEGLFSDEAYLKHLPAEKIVPGLEIALFEAFAHLYEVAFNIAKVHNRLAGKSTVELMQALRELAVYPIIEPMLLRGER